MRTRLRATVLLLAVFLVWLLVSAAAAEAPALSDLQRLQMLTLVQRMQIAELKAQAAQRDWDQARAELIALGRRLEVPGYELDVMTQTYRPVPRSDTGKEP